MRLPNIDWDDVLGYAGAALTVAIVAALFYSFIDFTSSQRAAAEAHFADCEYIGTRISDSWGLDTVYRYDCGGIIEETTRRLDK